LLRPNRRRRQQEQQAQQEQQTQQQQQAQAAQTQTEQIDSASRSDVPSTIPPTHPLATGQHSEPQTALPQPGAAAAPAVVAGSEDVAKEQAKKEGEDKAPVSPVAPGPVAKDEEPKSEPVSAVSAEHNKPVTPPKTDGAKDLRSDRMEHADPQITMRDMKLTITCEAPIHFPATTKEPVPATSKNAKPSVTVPATTTAPATAATAPTPASETQPATKTSFESARDEKMPVMAEEPPEIKAKAAAPGMSATSGPLDDFPIEDDKP
jgi:type II secretory pathway pseudopilin PulG